MAKQITAEKGMVVDLNTPVLSDAARKLRAIQDIEGIIAVKFTPVLNRNNTMPSIVAAIREITDLPITFDVKYGSAITTYTAEQEVSSIATSGIDYMTLFPFSGLSAHRALVQKIRAAGMRTITGANLTNSDFREEDGGYFSDATIKRIYYRAVYLFDETNLVVPGTRPADVARILSLFETKRFNLLIPGVGEAGQGGSIADIEAVVGEKASRWYVLGRAAQTREMVKEYVKQLRV